MKAIGDFKVYKFKYQMEETDKELDRQNLIDYVKNEIKKLNDSFT